jgi:NADH-quinone oxidoreductase subunit N
MQVQAIDHAALLPLYLASAAALLALFAGRAAKAAMMIGLAAAGAAAVRIAAGPDRATFAVDLWHSYVADDAAMGTAALFAALTVLVAAISGRQAGEYWFLLAVSAAGGIALAGARDLITLIVALETLTLPLYVLVTGPLSRAAPGGTGRERSEAGVTFLIASITSSATALMGAALMYAASGTVHLDGLAGALSGAHAGLVAAGVALLLGGIAFKLAAAPLHAWAPLVLERAPLPIATYLASASKLGGAIAITWVVHFGLAASAGGLSAGIVLAALSVASIVIGNLGALVQRRTVPLLAWSGIAHAGYVLAPLAVIATATGRGGAAAAASATLAYAVFFVLLEAGAFAALTAVRDDGGAIADLSGLWRTAPLPAAVLLFSVIGLAGLPPALAGTFAKVAVLEVLASSAVWLAVVVAAGAVLGLAYYLPLARTLLVGRGPAPAKGRFAVALALIGLALAVVSIAPQVVLEFTSVSR